MNQERRVAVPVNLKAGVNVLSVGALEAGTVLERVIIYKKGMKKPQNYMGPENSFVII